MRTEFITSENEHWYPSPKKKGVWYPSVTTILGFAFPKTVGFHKYLANQQSWESSQEILKAAGTRGTRVHEGTELLENGHVLKRDMYSLEEWQMLVGFVKWHEKYQPKAEAIELSLVSDKLKTGGTIDRVYIIDGVRTILDIKTSSAIHDSYWAQTSVYEALWAERYKDKPVEQTAILRLAPKRKDGYEYSIHTKEMLKDDISSFRASQVLWDYLNPNAQPKLLEVPEELTLCIK